MEQHAPLQHPKLDSRKSQASLDHPKLDSRKSQASLDLLFGTIPQVQVLPQADHVELVGGAEQGGSPLRGSSHADAAQQAEGKRSSVASNMSHTHVAAHAHSPARKFLPENPAHALVRRQSAMSLGTGLPEKGTNSLELSREGQPTYRRGQSLMQPPSNLAMVVESPQRKSFIKSVTALFTSNERRSQDDLGAVVMNAASTNAPAVAGGGGVDRSYPVAGGTAASGNGGNSGTEGSEGPLGEQSSALSGADDRDSQLASAVSIVGPLAAPSLTSSFAGGLSPPGRPTLLKRSSTQFSQSSAWGGEVGPLLNDVANKRKSFLGGPPGGLVVPGDVEHLQRIGSHMHLGEKEADTIARAMTNYFDNEEDDASFDWHSWLWTQKVFLWLFLEEPFLSRRTTIYSTFILGCIMTALCLSIETLRYTYVPEADEYIFREVDVAKGLADGDPATILKVTTVSIISLETLVRFLVVPVKTVYLLQPYGICDVVAILPFWMNDVLELSSKARFFHIFSLFGSLFWLLKLCRYFSGWHLLHKSLSDSMRALQIPAFFLLIIVFIGSCSIFWSEQSVPNDCPNDLSLEHLIDSSSLECGRKVNTLTDAMMFCIVCVISIDVSPAFGIEVKSEVGRLIAITMMVAGVIFMAMPIAIVGTSFSEIWFNRDQYVLIQKVRNRMTQQGYTKADLREVFDEVDEDCSGEIEFGEFRTMLEAFHFTSLKTAHKVFNYFDTTGTGSITFQEFCCGIFPDIAEHELEQLMSLADEKDRDLAMMPWGQGNMLYGEGSWDEDPSSSDNSASNSSSSSSAGDNNSKSEEEEVAAFAGGGVQFYIPGSTTCATTVVSSTATNIMNTRPNHLQKQMSQGNLMDLRSGGGRTGIENSQQIGDQRISRSGSQAGAGPNAPSNLGSVDFHKLLAQQYVEQSAQMMQNGAPSASQMLMDHASRLTQINASGETMTPVFSTALAPTLLYSAEERNGGAAGQTPTKELPGLAEGDPPWNRNKSTSGENKSEEIDKESSLDTPDSMANNCSPGGVLLSSPANTRAGDTAADPSSTMERIVRGGSGNAADDGLQGSGEEGQQDDGGGDPASSNSARPSSSESAAMSLVDKQVSDGELPGEREEQEKPEIVVKQHSTMSNEPQIPLSNYSNFRGSTGYIGGGPLRESKQPPHQQQQLANQPSATSSKQPPHQQQQLADPTLKGGRNSAGATVQGSSSGTSDAGPFRGGRNSAGAPQTSGSGGALGLHAVRSDGTGIGDNEGRSASSPRRGKTWARVMGRARDKIMTLGRANSVHPNHSSGGAAPSSGAPAGPSIGVVVTPSGNFNKVDGPSNSPSYLHNKMMMEQARAAMDAAGAQQANAIFRESLASHASHAVGGQAMVTHPAPTPGASVSVMSAHGGIMAGHGGGPHAAQHGGLMHYNATRGGGQHGAPGQPGAAPLPPGQQHPPPGGVGHPPGGHHLGGPQHHQIGGRSSGGGGFPGTRGQMAVEPQLSAGAGSTMYHPPRQDRHSRGLYAAAAREQGRGPPGGHHFLGAQMAKTQNNDMVQKLAARITALEVKMEESQRRLQFMLTCICDNFSIEIDWTQMPTARENKKLLAANPKRTSEKRASGRADGVGGDDSENRDVLRTSTTRNMVIRESSTGTTNAAQVSGSKMLHQSIGASHGIQSSDRLSSYRGFSSTAARMRGAGGRRLSHASILTGMKTKPRRGSNQELSLVVPSSPKQNAGITSQLSSGGAAAASPSTDGETNTTNRNLNNFISSPGAGGSNSAGSPGGLGTLEEASIGLGGSRAIGSSSSSRNLFGAVASSSLGTFLRGSKNTSRSP
ncbi:unnamed protein product [Amoebophrya sp. A25]|nr:unnamed protein product [Amoebophrya sp. A25]|eukprot:GSA25T00010129001.1